MMFLRLAISFSLHFSLIHLQIIEPHHPRISILGALTSDAHRTILDEQTNRLLVTSSKQEINLDSQSFLLDANPLLIAMKLCEMGNQSQAKAIIAGRGLDGNDLTLTAISYVSDFYQIPVLTIASRENLFSDKVENIDDRLFVETRLFFRRCIPSLFDWCRRLCTKPTRGLV